MKRSLTLFACLCICLFSFAQSNQWTWMGGDNTPDQTGIYGIKGVANSFNKPGSRNYSISWTDKSGNLWLFGGIGYSNSSSGYLNDLWKYDTYTGRWIWVSGDNMINVPGVYGTKGVANAANKPGGRVSIVSWIDASGNLWLFGGSGYTSSSPGLLNDLWKYDVTTGKWTWLSGDNMINVPGVYGTKGVANTANKPGGRAGSVSWIDKSGNLWLFGGTGYNGGHLNDLWKYNTTTGQWTWVSGDNISSQTGVYGTKGVANATNTPGGRENSMSWTDKSGNLWLFGGRGYGGFDFGYLNDLWRYNTTTGQWTWVNGDFTPAQPGIYGTKGVASTTNNPGSRERALSWTDGIGNLWLFGGFSSNSGSGNSYLNDLWKYNPSTDRWIWVSGDNTPNQPGVYGSKGVVNSFNHPGSREKSVSWTDKSGNLWLFGGSGFSSSSSGFLNDLWKYSPPLLIYVLPTVFTVTLFQGTSFTMSFKTTGQYDSTNFFTAQLSDTTGSFAAPLNLGTIGTNDSATYALHAQLPANTPAGSGYRIRVVSSSPFTIGELDSSITILAESLYYRDADMDGFGNPAILKQDTVQPLGYVTNNQDCNDSLASVNPAAIDICGNGIDDNCNGLVDEGCKTGSLPKISVKAVQVQEGNSDNTQLVFELKLSKKSGFVVAVQCHTTPITATANADYVPKTDTILFPAGTDLQTVSIEVKGDTLVEGNETFLLQLSNAINASLQDQSTTGTIVNDDVAPAVTIAENIGLVADPKLAGQKLSVVVAPNPANTLFNLQLSGGSDANVSIKVTDASGRLIETKTGIPARSSLQLGSNYRPGIYYAEVIQGGEKVVVKLVKQ